MTNRKIILAGGSGFIGQGLVEYFAKENEVVVLTRRLPGTQRNAYSQKLINANDGFRVRYVTWDGQTVTDEWSRELSGADLVVNLSGKSVNCRYHRKQRQDIRDSRIHSTGAIADAIRRAIDPPAVWINLASATIYCHTEDRPNDEFTGLVKVWRKDNMPYNWIDKVRYKKDKFLARISYGKNSTQYRELDLDFSVQVCKVWERAFFEEQTPATRKIALRTAITLGNGGVIEPYLNLCKFGLGGKHGNGNQMFSWVHMADVARMIEWLFDRNSSSGIYNCVSPNAVSNSCFMKTLRHITGHQIGLPAPAFLLEAGAMLIGTETELMLKSRWVLPTRALHEGFQFKYASLRDALEEIIATLPRRRYRLF